ncbi:MAG: hypothetical protein ACD_37C00234G0010, partial [uncultured bacterium]
AQILLCLLGRQISTETISEVGNYLIDQFFAKHKNDLYGVIFVSSYVNEVRIFVNQAVRLNVLLSQIIKSFIPANFNTRLLRLRTAS